MKYANIMITKVPGSVTDKHYRVRSGKEGKGKVLFSCTAWDNPQATFQAYCMCREWLEKHGYIGVNEVGIVSEDQWEVEYYKQV